MHRSDRVSFSLWKSGAYRAASFDERTQRGALVEHDGAYSMRLVGVTRDGFEETVATSRTVPGGLQLRVSTLRGRADGSIEWRWQVTRPDLRRDERLRIDPRGNASFVQTDQRAGRTTTFRSNGDGRYRGETKSSTGEVRSTSEWERDDRGGMNGTFTDAHGVAAGEMRIPDRESRGAGEAVSWTGPDSKGSISYGSDDRPKAAVVERDGDRETYTWDDGEDHYHQVGKSADSSWFKVIVPGKETGDTNWTEWGSQSTHDATNSSSDYTIKGVSHPDGSSSWERIDHNPTTGEDAHSFGGKDAEGNQSYSESVTHPDGSVTITTRTVDKNGNGTEHKTVVDPQGNVVSDGTSDVTGGVTQPGSGGGQGGGQAGGAQPGGGGSPGSGGNGGSPNTPDNPDSPDDPDKKEPEDPPKPEEPDPPDDGGGDDGRDNPDGSDDGRPTIPWGKLGHAGGDFGDGFAGLAGLGSGGDDDDESRRPDWMGNLRDGLGREIGDVLAGLGSAGGGGADETGWGNGGEGFRGVPLVSSGAAWHPTGADDSGWGDVNDPRALVAVIESFAVSSRALARSGVLAEAARR